MRPARLLVETDGEIVCRTFQAEWLVGAGTFEEGHVVVGFPADDTARWGGDYWCVLRGATGKLAVFRRKAGATAGQLQVFESFAQLAGKIPDNILYKAELAAGLREPKRYREEPLDV